MCEFSAMKGERTFKLSYVSEGSTFIPVHGVACGQLENEEHTDESE